MPELPWEWEYPWGFPYPWDGNGNGKDFFPVGIPIGIPIGIPMGIFEFEIYEDDDVGHVTDSDYSD